ELAEQPVGRRTQVSQSAMPGMLMDNLPYWSPLTVDKNAVRLAVQRRFNIEHMPPDAGDGPCVFVSVENHRDLAWVEFDGEEQRRPATRRAIVQAAAEIGRNMP